MKLTIHKGTNEIGGNCIELSTENTRILLDYGTPLKKGSKAVKLDAGFNAIIISHPHMDHFGGISGVDTSVPVYCGTLSRNLMNASRIFTGEELLKNDFKIYESWKTFEISDFTITPYLVDHSAVDAHSLLIECEGKRIIYSGDFRANGRKSKLYENFIKDKRLQGVDYLLMEGTMMGRSNNEFTTEQSVEEKIVPEISKNNYLSFMIGSSQNIDTMVSAYRACKRTNKILVVDMYTAWVLENIKEVSDSTPNIDWDDIKVLKEFSYGYYKNMKNNKEYFKEFTGKIFENCVELDKLARNPSGYFMKISPWHIGKVLSETALQHANIIYSQWLGYLELEYNDEKSVGLFTDLKNNYNWVYAHTSGHADLEALQKLASSINPKNLIPIHTEHKDKYNQYFDNVVVLQDGVEYDLDELPDVQEQ